MGVLESEWRDDQAAKQLESYQQAFTISQQESPGARVA